MNFEFESALPILARTPAVLDGWLRDLPAGWTLGTDGPNTWSPFDVVGHLIHGERTDWIPRIEHLLAHGESAPFPPFDRFAQYEASKGKSLGELLDTSRSRARWGVSIRKPSDPGADISKSLVSELGPSPD